MNEKKSIQELLKELGEINDSYEDILWSDLEYMTDEKAEVMTVREWLEEVWKEHFEPDERFE